MFVHRSYGAVQTVLRVNRTSLNSFLQFNMSPPHSGKKRKETAPTKAGAVSKDFSATNSIRQQAGSSTILLTLRCKPGASESKVVSVSAECVEVAVGAPPTDGEANTELIRFLSKLLGCRKGNLTLSSGHKSRDKVIALDTTDTGTSFSVDRIKVLLESDAAS